MKQIVCVLLLTLGVAAPASAQLCTGTPSFRDRPYQVGMSTGFTEGLRGVEGTFAGGGESVFAGAGLSVLNFTDADVRTAGVSGFLGAEVATEDSDQVLLCPILRLGFVAGPDVGAVDISTASLQGGGNIAVIVSDDGNTMVVPFFGLAAVYQRVTVDVAGVEDSASDTGGIADLGVGFIFNRTMGITPSVSIPFAISGDPVFTIRFTLNFGR